MTRNGLPGFNLPSCFLPLTDGLADLPAGQVSWHVSFFCKLFFDIAQVWGAGNATPETTLITKYPSFKQDGPAHYKSGYFDWIKIILEIS